MVRSSANWLVSENQLKNFDGPPPLAKNMKRPARPSNANE